ncbi:hypothetical protein Cni_G09472 [Canna indica]|uniref:SWIM-type domain-containing protein n=1 Tax=Canna indica TaxID=4628 RepID=A0AAQ3K2D8_9LILI|nr:hypothetical protein Cni_G09472 [Canna indica]
MPIIELLNWIREYLMIRFAKNRIMCERYKGKSMICPKPRKRLDKHVLKYAKWRASWAGGTKYEVRNFDGEQFTIDISIKYCSCRLWALCGLPCAHAVCAIYSHSGDPHEFVDFCCWITTYETCYSPTINPINGEKM